MDSENKPPSSPEKTEKEEVSKDLRPTSAPPSSPAKSEKDKGIGYFNVSNLLYFNKDKENLDWGDGPVSQSASNDGGGYGSGRESRSSAGGWGRSGGGGGSSTSGDWNCDCGANNYASRYSCFKCHKSKPADGGGGGGGSNGYQSSFRDRNSSYGNESSDSEYGRGGGGRGGFGGGRGGGPAGSRPGDWSCDCGANNFASRYSCFKCQKSKPEDAGGADGGGGSNGYQSSFRDRNSSYGNDSSDSGYGRGGGGRGSFGGGRGGGPAGSRPGDWSCDCGVNNFASRYSCFKCQKPKPEDAGGADGGGRGSFGGGRGGGPAGSRPGDWSCDCGANNFASRYSCFKCQKSKSEDAGGADGGGGGGGGSNGYQSSFRDRNSSYGNDSSDSGYGRGGGGRGGFGGGRGGGPAGSRPGDWSCDCGANNFASRYSCFKCQKPKPEGGDSDKGGGGGGGGGFQHTSYRDRDPGYDNYDNGSRRGFGRGKRELEDDKENCGTPPKRWCSSNNYDCSKETLSSAPFGNNKNFGDRYNESPSIPAPIVVKFEETWE